MNRCWGARQGEGGDHDDDEMAQRGGVEASPASSPRQSVNDSVS